MLLKFRSVIGLGLTSLLTCSLIVGWHTQVLGQVPLNNQIDSVNLPPLEVTRYGNFEVTWVKSALDRQKLFRVASPTVIDRSSFEGDRLPVELRAKNIQAMLRLAVNKIKGDLRTQLTKILDPQSAAKGDSFSSEVFVSRLRERPVVQVKTFESSLPLTIATVTQSDVQFYSQTAEQIAINWQKSISEEIERIEYLTSPQIVRRRFWQAVAILMGILVASSILGLIYWLLGRRLGKLRLKYDAGIEASKSATAKMQSILPDNSTETFGPETVLNVETGGPETDRDKDLVEKVYQRQKSRSARMRIYKLLRWLIIWLVIIGWYLSIYSITTRFPLLMRYSKAILSQPLKLLVIWFLVGLSLQIAKTSINYSIDAWKTNSYLSFGESQRKSLRLTTITTALEGFAAFILIGVGIILTLTLFNISTGSILAGGAVIGLAISFGMQNLIKDVVNGCLILLEDRFAVGDVIIINGMDGFVEGFNLRITKLRNPEGQLITIPNSAIAEVRNLTRLWSRVDFTIEVAYENDPDKVLQVLEEVSREMHESPEWQDKISSPPEILGIDRLSHSGMLIRVWIVTAPLQQWLVGREYRLRVRRAFEKHKIVIGRPQWVNYGASLNGEVAK
jgi:small conductance mechanosensitive channel